MPSKIQQIARGLLDQLGIKGTGINPENLLDDVRPVMDVTNYYGLAKIEQLSTSETTVNPSEGQSFGVQVIPPGEAWRVHGIGYRLSNLSTSVFNVSWKSFIRAGGTGTALRVGEINADSQMTNAEQYSEGHIFTPPLVLPPGSELGLVCERDMVTHTLDVISILIIERLGV